MTNKEYQIGHYVFLRMPFDLPRNFELKYSWKWGLCIFSVLIFMSVIFYQERIGLLDNAFQLFLILHEGKITSMADRWPDVINRFLPFIGFKMGLSLKSLMVLFSISYPLIQFLLYTLTYLVEKQRIWSIMSICCLTFAVSDSFYWCASELIHGLSWLMLLMALFFRKDQLNMYAWIALISISVICLNLHPLLIFPFGFILLYHFIYMKQFSKNGLILLTVFMILWVGKSQFLGNWYDDYKSQEFIQNFAEYKFSLWNIPSHVSFISELPIKYYVLLILLVFNGIWMVYKHKYAALSFLIVSLALYILIVHIGNPEATNSFYREVAYIPITVFSSISTSPRIFMRLLLHKNTLWFSDSLLIFNRAYLYVSFRLYGKKKLDTG